MKPLRSKDDLTALAARHAPTKACASAMKENRAVVLGGFTAPGTLPCYIVRVTSRHGRVWDICVECDEQARSYRVRVLDQVPWQHWAGRSDGKHPLIDGDMPVVAAYMRMQARRNK
jgi:hypothetical protein